MQWACALGAHDRVMARKLDASNTIPPHRSQVSLVGGAIKLNHLLVNGLLLSNIHTLQGRSNESLYILDGLEHALAQVTTLVFVTKLAGLVDASGCTWVKNTLS